MTHVTRIIFGPLKETHILLMRHYLIAAALTTSVLQANAQSTFSSINNIFQASCTNGCHTAGSPSGNLILDTDGDLNALYANLVGVMPTNPAAAAKGYKLIDPGYPANSFLLRKCAYEQWDDAYDLPVAQGVRMPQGQPVLAKEEVELIRQWVLYGAKQNGQAVNPQTLYNYYHVNGMARIPRPAAPTEGEGYQMHLGPFFLNPGQEVEFYKKEVLTNDDVLNVVRFESHFNEESHHFLLFQFDPGTENSVGDGLRPVTIQNAFQDARYMVGWVSSDETDLPQGAAYKVRQNGALDLNYHLINYASNGDSILAAEAYVNFYVDNDPGLVEMHSELLIYLAIAIINNGQEQTFTNARFCGLGGGTNDFCSLPGDSIYLWYLSSHTHKYGTDYNIFKRLPGGGKGEQVYDGFYNTTYDFNQGFYDWSHPAQRYFDELMPVAKNTGLIQEAKYRINNPNESAFVINFGLTTDDEMMLAFIQYTTEPLPEQTGPNSVFDRSGGAPSFLTVYPNPSQGETTVSYTLDRSANVQLDVFNGLGQHTASLTGGTQAAGQYTHRITLDRTGSADGLYFIRLAVDGEVHTQRVILTR